LVEEIEILQNDLAAKYAINNRMTLNLTADITGLILMLKNFTPYKIMEK
jgi:hypothetical protein